MAPKSQQNSLQKTAKQTGAPVGDQVNRNAVEPDDVGQQQLGSLWADRSLGNGRKWATSLKRTTAVSRWMQETSWSLDLGCWLQVGQA